MPEMAYRHPVMPSRESREKPAGNNLNGAEIAVYRDPSEPVFGPSVIEVEG